MAAAASDSARMDGKPRDAVLRWAMGRVMPGLIGRVDPARASELLESALGPAAPAETT